MKSIVGRSKTNEEFPTIRNIFSLCQKRFLTEIERNAVRFGDLTTIFEVANRNDRILQENRATAADFVVGRIQKSTNFRQTDFFVNENRLKTENFENNFKTNYIF